MMRGGRRWRRGGGEERGKRKERRRGKRRGKTKGDGGRRTEANSTPPLTELRFHRAVEFCVCLAISRLTRPFSPFSRTLRARDSSPRPPFPPRALSRLSLLSFSSNRRFFPRTNIVASSFFRLQQTAAWLEIKKNFRSKGNFVSRRKLHADTHVEPFFLSLKANCVRLTRDED